MFCNMLHISVCLHLYTHSEACTFATARYVKLQPDEEVRAGKRLRKGPGGFGAKSSTKNSGRGGGEEAAPGALYGKWAARHKLSVGRGGKEVSGGALSTQELQNR